MHEKGEIKIVISAFLISRSFHLVERQEVVLVEKRFGKMILSSDLPPAFGHEDNIHLVKIYNVFLWYCR